VFDYVCESKDTGVGMRKGEADDTMMLKQRKRIQPNKAGRKRFGKKGEKSRVKSVS